jgi:hypothetical protein
VGGLLSALV